MKRAYRILPIYTGDVSGVASALYELGGMVVMHDPSGCNSTYNTHDEIRWYEQDSRIYLSGLTETDAILGNDEKLIRDVCEAAEKLPPKFIALAGSPIPFLNGTDMPAIARIIEKRTGIPCFSVPTNGMHDYVYGAGLAMAELAKRFCVKESGEAKTVLPHTVNLLGVTPLDFGPLQMVEKLKKNLEQHGWKIWSCWAMGDELEQLSKAGLAEVNLVVSSAGLETALVLKERFGTPYVIGTPWDEYAGRIAEALERKEKLPYISDRETGEKITVHGENCNGSKSCVLIGEPVTMGSLAAMIEKKHGRPARVICPLKKYEGLLADCDRAVTGEEELEDALKDAEIVIADPLYKPVVPKTVKFHELPHIAFSGRIFLRDLLKHYC